MKAFAFMFLCLLGSVFSVAPASAEGVCTVPNSLVQNTGKLVTQAITAGPVAGIAKYTICQDQRNEWNLTSDYKLNLQQPVPTNPFGAWTLLSAPSSFTSPTMYSVLGSFANASDSPLCAQYGQSCWTLELTNLIPNYLGPSIFWINSSGMVEGYTDQSYSSGYKNVVRWSAPASGGTFTLTGSLQMQQACGYGNDFSVYLGLTLLTSGHLIPGNGPTPISISNIVMKGNDSLYVVTTPVTSYPCQEVIYNLQVNRQ
jgi:hypothetical protein